jgi:hypothetical protein
VVGHQADGTLALAIGETEIYPVAKARKRHRRAGRWKTSATTSARLLKVLQG